jgi:hypothetical protein
MPGVRQFGVAAMMIVSIASAGCWPKAESAATVSFGGTLPTTSEGVGLAADAATSRKAPAGKGTGPATKGNPPARDTALPAKDTATSAKEIYSPVADDFRPSYDRDTENQQRESWNEYWSWVQQFYNGNLFDQGWKKRTNEVLQGIQSEKVRDELRARLNDLSRLIAAEWSRDNDIRRISTSDLSAYGNRLRRAKSKDGGNGNAIRAEIAAIRADVEARLGR